MASHGRSDVNLDNGRVPPAPGRFGGRGPRYTVLYYNTFIDSCREFDGFIKEFERKRPTEDMAASRSSPD
jgi:hypothetical protein